MPPEEKEPIKDSPFEEEPELKPIRPQGIDLTETMAGRKDPGSGETEEREGPRPEEDEGRENLKDKLDQAREKYDRAKDLKERFDRARPTKKTGEMAGKEAAKAGEAGAKAGTRAGIGAEAGGAAAGGAAAGGAAAGGAAVAAGEAAAAGGAAAVATSEIWVPALLILLILVVLYFLVTAAIGYFGQSEPQESDNGNPVGQSQGGANTEETRFGGGSGPAAIVESGAGRPVGRKPEIPTGSQKDLIEKALAHKCLTDQTGEKAQIKQGIIRSELLRTLIAVADFACEKGFKIRISSLKSDHSTYAKSGNISNHHFGLAADIGNESIAPQLLPWLKENSQTLGINELIFDSQTIGKPSNSYNLRRGKPASYGSGVLNGHRDHIHLSVLRSS